MSQFCTQDPPSEIATLPDQQPKTIMVVEDELLILNLMQDILADIGGYRVLVASTSRDALLLAAQQAAPPDLLVLDYRLFGSPLNGLELYDLLHVRDGWQGVPAVFASCNIPEDEVQPRGTLLRKPFDYQKLLAVVAATLISPRSP